MTTLQQFIDAGYRLTDLEVDAIACTRPDLWDRIAQQIDARLQKARLIPGQTGKNHD